MIFTFKRIGQTILALAIIGAQVIFLSAYEAHVVNVKTRICNLIETRTIGYWKTHLDVIIDNDLLPQYMGGYPDDEEIWVPQFQEIFENANADDMVDMLKAQLLGMKFNVAYFGSGNFEYDGMTIQDIIDLSDEALRQSPLPPRDYLEYLKDLLAYLNEEHQLTHCSDPDSGLTLFGNNESYIAQLISAINSIEIVIEPTTCAPEAKQECDTGLLGVCGKGTQWCDQYGFWSECMQTIASTTEICDNVLDDNCNGLTDCDDELCFEDSVCQANPDKKPEYSGESVCGDDILDEVKEECDDGNTVDGDGCSSTCEIEEQFELTNYSYCGDGNLNGTEQCDNGESNGVECTPTYPLNCTYCSTDCTTTEVQGAYCGDGVVDEPYEDCDDGNTVDGDGCSSTCLIEQPPEPQLPESPCTDKDQDGYSVEGQECGLVDCDDSNPNINPGVKEICGNQVDDDCDYLIDCSDTTCSQNLSCQPKPVCGDGVIDEGEECDDGNTESGDGCSIICVIEQEPEPVCGDGNLDILEECDDGNLLDGDGCSSICLIEQPES